MKRTGPRWRAACVALCALAAIAAHAGGHFDVDDAAMLSPGECQYELWASRPRGHASESFQHVGPSCRIGAVEWGLNADRSASADGTDLSVGPQLKWTFWGQDADAPLSAALAAGISRDVRHGGRAGGQLVVPLTWQATPQLALDVNVGSDWTAGTGERTRRLGLATQWSVNQAVALIAERNLAATQWTSRIGTRINLTPFTSVDLSVARTGPQGVRSVIVGLNQVFGGR